MTNVPAAGSGNRGVQVDVPGSYKLVDHSILRAFNKGAIGELKVEGPDNKAIYSGKQSETAYQPAIASAPASPAPKPAAGDLHVQMAVGSKLYTTYCQGCHQPVGQGLPGPFPSRKTRLLDGRHVEIH